MRHVKCGYCDTWWALFTATQREALRRHIVQQHPKPKGR